MIQDLLYVPVDFAAYEHCTKYCPDCDYEFPSVYMEAGAEYNDSYGAAYDEEGMEIGFVDKKHGGGVMLPAKVPVEGETMFVSKSKVYWRDTHNCIIMQLTPYNF